MKNRTMSAPTRGVPAGASMGLQAVGGVIVSRRSLAVGCSFALLAVACVVTRQGTLTKVSSGAVFPVSVVVAADSATVRGTNPENGESLEGTFHLDSEGRAPSPMGVPGPAPPIGGGAVSPGTGPRPVSGRPVVLELTGRLEGDKGTSLRCSLQIKKGLRLEGMGLCRSLEGEEESAVFRIRF